MVYVIRGVSKCVESFYLLFIIYYYIIYSQIKFAKNTCKRCLMCAIKVSFSAYNCKNLFNLPHLAEEAFNVILSLGT